MKKSTIIEIIIIIMLGIVLGVIIYISINNSLKMDGFEGKEEKDIIENSSVETKSVKEITGEESINDNNISSTQEDTSAIMSTNGGKLTASNLIISKTGDTTNTENSEFYGLNAGVLAKTNSKITISNSNITTNAKGANAVFATGENSNINLSNVEIQTSQDSSRGLDATYGGNITGDNVKISTKGAHCAALATDRGEGTINVSNSNLNTAGESSPCIYSTGNITINNTEGLATGSSISVIEGKNSITVKNSKLVAYGYGRANGGIDNAGIMIYQSMSGDASVGEGTFTSTDSTLTISKESNIYNSAPMFFSTNTDAVINLKNTVLSFGSNILLKASGNTGEWGQSGSNGANVTLNAENQTLTGNIISDKISIISINLTNSILTSTINKENTAKQISIKLDSNSKWNVTGTSYITTITDEDETLSNIISNGNTIYYNSSNSSNSWLNGRTIILSDGGTLKPM